jgi:hypothetical protein
LPEFSALVELIWLGLRAFALKVDALHHARLRENMMAAGNAHPKSFRLQQMTKFLKANVGVRISAQNFVESFFGTHGFVRECSSGGRMTNYEGRIKSVSAAEMNFRCFNGAISFNVITPDELFFYQNNFLTPA